MIRYQPSDKSKIDRKQHVFEPVHYVQRLRKGRAKGTAGRGTAILGTPFAEPILIKGLATLKHIRHAINV